MSSKFAVATHILTLLAHAEPDTLTSSDYIAGSVNTSPVVVRRMLGALKAAGFVETREGSQGGAQLALPPEQITLLDVYRAVDDGTLFDLHRNQPSPYCEVGRGIKGALQVVIARAQSEMENELASTTIAQMLADVLGHSAD